MLSAFVCPGAGQYVQGRWPAAIFYCGGTIALMVWLVWISVVQLYISVFAFLQSPDLGYEVELKSIAWRDVMWTLIGILVLYGFNVLDAVYANRRRIRAYRARTTPPQVKDLEAG